MLKLVHHKAGGGFRNPWPNAQPRGLGDVFRWLMWERVIHPRPRDPLPHTFPICAPSIRQPMPAEGVSITWIGHSSTLIQIDGANILTDPVWSLRASPFRHFGPRRWTPPGLPFESIPRLDAILLSHDHYDHFDLPTVRRLAAEQPEAVWCMPLGLDDLASKAGVRRIEVLDWWEQRHLGSLTVTCAPAQHFSGRTARDRFRRLWCSWCLQGRTKGVYFGGDSGLHPEFARIGAAYGPFHVALLPIGAYAPRWFMRTVHMDPAESVSAYQELIAAQSIDCVFVPIHWGTFKLADEPMREPPRLLLEAWTQRHLDARALAILSHGETREF